LVLFPEPVIHLFELRYPPESYLELRFELSETDRLVRIDSLKLRDAEFFGVAEDLGIKISLSEMSSPIRQCGATTF
jgi:hypothetical protein